MQTRTMGYDPHLPFQRRTLPPDAGLRLRAAREGRGLSRRAVAAQAEIAPRTLARIERGAQRPTWSTLDRLCEVLQVEVSTVAARWLKDWTDLPTSASAAPGLGLRALRRSQGVTLVDLSKASGISVATLSRFERGLVASRTLLKGPVSHDQEDVEIENDRLAAAFGLTDSSQLRMACLAAAGEPRR